MISDILNQCYDTSRRVFELNQIILFSAKKSKATIELIIKTQPDKYKQNEVWYNGGLDDESTDNLVDTGFDEKGN